MARVLVVDDDVELLDSLVDAVAFGGHEVSTAANGREALQMLRSRAIDLVVLDLMMPEMNGAQFRAEQMRDPSIAHVPVIVVSAASPLPQLDAAEVLPKPFDLDALLSAVARHSLRP
jgi:CheY-like chemotaxis protein